MGQIKEYGPLVVVLDIPPIWWPDDAADFAADKIRDVLVDELVACCSARAFAAKAAFERDDDAVGRY